MISGASLLEVILNLCLSTEQTILLQKIFFCSPLLISKEHSASININWDLNSSSITIFSNKNIKEKILICELSQNNDINIDQSTISKFYVDNILQKTVKQDQFYKFLKFRNYNFSNQFASVERINYVCELDEKSSIIYGMVYIKYSDKLDIIIDAAFQSMVYVLLQYYKVF